MQYVGLQMAIANFGGIMSMNISIVEWNTHGIYVTAELCLCAA